MTLPIYSYGHPILRQKTNEIDANYPDLKSLVDKMWSTMYNANGVGLAAPQIGLAIRLFVVDASPFAADPALSDEEQQQVENFKHVFINPTITDFSGDLVDFNEGCLSIPDVREDVSRHERIRIHYWDEQFKEQELVLTGLAARVVQHEYDHIEGILFTDHLTSLKRRLLKNRLNSISKGAIQVDYPMKFPNKTKR